MASTDATPIPKKNVAYRVTFPILDADGDLVTGATGLDSEISKDAGTFADCTNEATEIATSSGMYYLDLTSTEMNADTVALIIKTSSSGAKTTPIILYPEEAGDIRVDVTMLSGDAAAADNAEAFFDGTGYAGTNNVIPTVTTLNGLAAGVITATSIAANAITAAKVATDAIGAAQVAADAITEIQAGLSTLDAAGIRAAVGLATANLDTQLADIDNFIDTEVAAILAAVDTEVAAIKAKTDNLPAAPAATGDIPTANANADALLDRAAGVETGYTLRQALRLVLAACAGKLSGAATTTVAIRDMADTKDRISATVDSDGNRTAVTLDAT